MFCFLVKIKSLAWDEFICSRFHSDVFISRDQVKRNRWGKEEDKDTTRTVLRLLHHLLSSIKFNGAYGTEPPDFLWSLMENNDSKHPTLRPKCVSQTERQFLHIEKKHFDIIGLFFFFFWAELLWDLWHGGESVLCNQRLRLLSYFLFEILSKNSDWD